MARIKGVRLTGLAVSNEESARLVADPRLPVVSFTGSVPVGWGIRDSVPRKHVALELGGNAAVLVCPDWTDLDYAAQRIATATGVGTILNDELLAEPP